MRLSNLHRRSNPCITPNSPIDPEFAPTGAIRTCRDNSPPPIRKSDNCVSADANRTFAWRSGQIGHFVRKRTIDSVPRTNRTFGRNGDGNEVGTELCSSDGSSDDVPTQSSMVGPTERAVSASVRSAVVGQRGEHHEETQRDGEEQERQVILCKHTCILPHPATYVKAGTNIRS
jgi:hypothetical protein